jgi:CBS domain-containing protein
MTDTTVAEIMTEPVLTVAADEPLSEVAWAMTEQNIRSLAVIDEDCRPLGILTSTDFLQMAADESDPTDHTVEDYMTTDVETVETSTPVSEIPDRLLDGGFNHIPVVSDDEVVGMVSTTDLLAHFE